MDKKVKITLVIVCALMVIIIGRGLYQTCNPKKENTCQKEKKPQNAQQIFTRDKQENLGVKAQMSIKTNKYYFPKKKRRQKVDPAFKKKIARLAEEDSADKIARRYLEDEKGNFDDKGRAKNSKQGRRHEKDRKIDSRLISADRPEHAPDDDDR
ncbi:MAG: hypothetical protein L6416_12825 [Candidatus Omnitrophica bacterium]|nr:hypothetical protein [Candidatus Omnitrophota bacterium]